MKSEGVKNMLTQVRPIVIGVSLALLVASCAPAAAPSASPRPSAVAATAAATVAATAAATPAQGGIVPPKPLGPGEQAIVIRYGDCCAPQTTNAIFGEFWKQLIEKYGNGRVRLDVFHNGTLGDQRALWEGIPLGTHDATFNGAEIAANFDKRMGVFGLPFLFETEEQAYKVFDSPVGEELLRALEPKGYKSFGFTTLGLRGTATVKRPLNSINDFKGFKLRIAESPVNRKTWEALGANPVPMNFNDVVPALQQGVIEGVDLPASFIVSSKLYEQLKIFAPTNHTMVVEIAGMSLPKFNSYPKEVQDVLTATAKEAVRMHRAHVIKERDTAIETLKTKGVQITTIDTRPMVDAMKPVYAELGKDYGDLVQRILAFRQK